MSGTGDVEFDRMIDAPPGPELAAWLCTLDLDDVSAHDLVAVAAAWERYTAFTEARKVQILAELTERPEYQQCSCPADADIAHMHRPVEPVGDEVSLALAWSPGRARHEVSVATELCDELPGTLTALEDGLIDYDKARLIADRTRCLGDPELRHRVERHVLARAPRQTRTQLDRALRREVIAADPDAAEQRRRTGAQQRRVSQPEPAAPGGEDGMARVELYGPAEDLAALFTAVDAAARHARATGDQRTLDQLRFDIVTGLGWTALDTGHLGCCNPTCAQSGHHDLATVHGKAATVNVTVSAFTLLGADDDPAHLDGFGAITADAARRISTEGPWRRLLVEPVGGQLLDYGRTTYAPPADLTAFVITRDVTCRFPTCVHPARHGDIDHKYPYERGGDTSATNTWALHDGHHFGKTHHRFTIHTDADGTTWWTTPAGHTYPVEPESLGPITASPATATRTAEPVPF